MTVPHSPQKQPITGEPPSLAKRYQAVRLLTESHCATLETEDYVVQTMPDVSPAKWHLAHVTWFYETLILEDTGYLQPQF